MEKREKMSEKHGAANANCLEVDLLLEAHLDGDLPAAQTSLVRTHLEGCPACRRQLALAAEVRRELAALPEVAPREQMLRGILARPRPAGRAAGGWWGGWKRHLTPRPLARPAFAALLLALAVAAGLLFVPEPRPVAPAPGYSDAEVARARQEARLALAYVAAASHRGGLALRDEVLRRRVVEPPLEALEQPMEALAKAGLTPAPGRPSSE